MSGVERAANTPVRRAAVIGSGAWGTTFASLLAQAGTPTTIWARRREVADEINAGTNERYVPGHRLPSGLEATTDLTGAVKGAGVVVVAVGAIANILAVFGLRERGEKQRLAAQASERRQQRLGG